MKMTFFINLLFMSLTIFSCQKDDSVLNQPQEFTNKIEANRMTLVLAAPSIHDSYYADRFNDIVTFQVNYANAIIGNDNVIIIVDEDTKRFYQNRVPEDILITSEIYDIWMRDFTTVNPINPVQFKYTNASMSTLESVQTQASFNSFANQLNLERSFSNYLIDGGNIVDNYHGKIIVTERFLTDNNLGKSTGKQVLKDLLNATEVAIIEADDPVLAHADGMVMWLDKNTLLVNDYGDEPEFRNTVISELYQSFPNTNIIEVPVLFDDNSSNGISSACGVNLNSVLTYHTIYVPVFGLHQDQEALQIIKNNTTKKVIPINASGVCEMGGSVRCLTWQVTGTNAEQLIFAGRN